MLPSTGPEPHRHSREEEGFYILEGQYEFRVGTQVIKAGPGDFLFAPRNVPHTYKNIGTMPSRHLTIISPAGLERTVGGKLTALSLVSGVIAHDLYHAGQIQLLRRLQRGNSAS